MNMTLLRTLPLTATIGMFALMSFTGCDKKGTASIPKDADSRISTMAAKLPAGTEAALFVGDVAKMRTSLNDINTLSDAIPELGATQKQVEAEIGFDPLDANSWKQAGIPDNSALSVSFVNNRTVIMVFVEDRQKFDTMLSEKLKKAMDSTEAPKAQDVGGKQVKVMGKDKEQIAWLHDGKLAIIATSVLDEKFTYGDTSGAADFVAKLPATKEAESALKTPQFAQYTKGITSDYSVGAFANIQAILKNEALRKEIEQNQDPSTKEIYDRLEKEAQIAGLGLHQDGQSFKITALYGADEATNKELAALGKPTAKSPFTPFASESMLLGVRTSLNTEKLWAYYMKNLPEEQKAQIVKGLQDAGKQAQIDIEKDIINNLTGNVGIFLYGLNAGAMMGAMNNPQKAAQSLNLAVGVQFKDAKNITMLLDKVKAQAGITPVEKDGVQVIMLPQEMGAIYVKDNLLVFGAKELKEADALSLMNGKAPNGKLSGELGSQFASDAPYGGLYVNIDKVSAIVNLLAANTPVSDVLNKIGEVALTTDNTDGGEALNLRFTLKATGGAEKK